MSTEIFRAYSALRIPGARAMDAMSTGATAACRPDGWYLAEPGTYTLHALLRTPEFVIVAAPKRIRIAYSYSWDEEVMAQDFFTGDVGRAFAFGASHGITAPIETLREVMDGLSKRAAARHAAIALAQPWMRDRPVCRRQAEVTAWFSKPLFVRNKNHDIA